jgi:uncharacterized damage-inducible protein DinB
MTRKEFIEYYKSACNPMISMMKMAPQDKLDWKPNDKSWTLGQLLEHSSHTPDAITAALTSSFPPFEEMQKMMANSLSNPKMSGIDAAKAFEAARDRIVAGLNNLSDADYSNKQLSLPWGVQGSAAMILQAMVDHQNNHKHDLFTYLKQIGLPVNTMTLYFG